MNRLTNNGSLSIRIENIKVEGKGGIILTGPSSCGKGEISKELCSILSIPKERHLSMGEILRKTIIKARIDHEFRTLLHNNYHISDSVSIFDQTIHEKETIEKVVKHKKDLFQYFKKEDISQLDWLEFCVNHGFLIPDDWTIQIVNATFANNQEYKNEIFILDGYPRTEVAAEALLETFSLYDIPIIKVIHLSITKSEMIKRANNRNRSDDTISSLERRYQFYIDSVQPSIDYLKIKLGSSKIALIDAHQPIFINGELDVSKSIKQVALSVLQSLGIPTDLLDL